jgi:hypothetical protein
MEPVYRWNAYAKFAKSIVAYPVQQLHEEWFTSKLHPYRGGQQSSKNYWSDS